MNLKKISKKVKAVVLLAAVLTTSIPSGFLTSGIVKAEGEISLAAEEDYVLEYNNFDFKYTTKESNPEGSDWASFNVDASGNYTLPSTVGVAQITGIKGNISFYIPTDHEKNMIGKTITYQFPNILSVTDVAEAKLSLTDPETGDVYDVANYNINNNKLTLTFICDDLLKTNVNPTVYVEGGVEKHSTIEFKATINKDVLRDASSTKFSLNADGKSETPYIEIPKLPASATHISETGEVKTGNMIYWTVTLGDASEAGASLKGATIRNAFDDSQILSKVYWGTDETDASKQITLDNLTKVDGTTNTYEYTITEDMAAPSVITFVTYPDETKMLTAFGSTDGKLVATSTPSLFYTTTETVNPGTAEESTIKKTTDPIYINWADATQPDFCTVDIQKATFDKKGTVIDGNHVGWEFIVNSNRGNIYGATITDALDASLKIDETTGIVLTELTASEEDPTKDVEGSPVQLSKDASAGNYYTYEENTLKVHLSTFNKKYKIYFVTEVEKGSHSSEGDAGVNNKATIEVYYPKGGGAGGTAQKWDDADLISVFRNAMTKTEKVSKDETKGTLSWKAIPSTRLSDPNYSYSEIILTLGDGHDFLFDTVKLYDQKNDAEITSGYEITTKENKKVVIKYTGSTEELNKLYVGFDTKADKATYFGVDDKEFTYTATSALAMKSSDATLCTSDEATATNKLINHMISQKVETSYNDENGDTIFTFTLKVNENKVGLSSGAKVTEDFTDALRAVKIGGNIDVTADGKEKEKITTADRDAALDGIYYEIVETPTSSKGTVSVSGKEVTVSYADGLSDTDEITVKVRLTNAAKDELKVGGFLAESYIYANATAKVTATELSEMSATVTGGTRKEIATNKVVVKENSESVGTELTWGIDINSMGAEMDLSHTTITDTIPAGMTLDNSSVKLYVATHGTDGTLISGTGTEITKENGFSYEAKRQKNGCTLLTLKLPTGNAYKNASFGLVYKTVVVKAGDLNNKADVVINGSTFSATAKAKLDTAGKTGATIRAFLKMKKVDATFADMPVEGAKYGIYATKADAEEAVSSKTDGSFVDINYTDSKGEITFVVPGALSFKSAKTYYVVELAVPDRKDGDGNYVDSGVGTYVRDEKIYEISGVTRASGTISIGPGGLNDSTSFKDERVKDASKTGQVTITNTFLKDQKENQVSTFELYVTSGKTEKRVFVEKESDGTYKFLGYVEDAEKSAKISGTNSKKNSENSENSVGNITIKGLPWGNYKLKQTETAAGFILADPVTFEIKMDEHENIKNPGTVNVDNEMTRLEVKSEKEVSSEFTFNGKTYTASELYAGVTLDGIFSQGQKNIILEAGSALDGYTKHDNVTIAEFVNKTDKNATGVEFEPIKNAAKKVIGERVILSENKISLNVVVKDQDGNPVSDAGLSVTADKDETVTGATLDLTEKVSVNKDYVITGTLTNQYMPIVSESVTVHVGTTGTSFTSDPTTDSTNKDVMSGSVDKNTLTITVQKIKANVEILEYSETDTQKKTPLTAGTFELHKVTGEGASQTDTVVTKWSSVTDESDPTKPDISALEVGTYYILQKAAPSGYETIATNLKSDKFTIDASMNGKTIEVPFVVHPVPGKITLTKKANGNVIKNNPAEYQLYVLSGSEYVKYKDASNKEVKATTNDDGVMVFENLPWGSYKVKETIAPKGYKLNSEMHGAYVIDATNQNIARDVSDDPTTVKIKTEGINISNGAEDETGATKDAIKASYTIKGDFADGLTELQVVDNGPNDSDPVVGSITVSNKFVLGNNYTFEQTAVDKPYLTNEHPFAEAQKIDTGDETVTVKNYMTRFGVKLTSEYDQILSGKFEIKDADGKTVVVNEFETPSLENAGVYEVCGLAPGTYTLVEKVAPVITDTNGIKKYYALDDTGIKFELKADNTVKVLSVNTVTWMVREYDHSLLNNGTVEGAKLGESGSFKKSKEAILTYANTPTVLQFNVAVRYNETCNEDKDAIAYLPGISYGIYKTSACDDGDLLAKTTTVKKENDEITNSMVGVLAVDGLPNSKDDNDFYYVRMIENKESNIEYDSNVYKIQVDNYLTPLLKKMDGSLAGRIELNVHRQDLTFVKKDAEDDTKLLEGSTYALYRKDSENAKTIANTTAPSATDPQFSILKNVATIPGLSYIFAASSVSAADSWTTKVAEATTGTDGSVTFTGVDVGVEYMIQEVKAPAGYQISKDPIKVKFVRDTATNAISLQSVDHGNNTATIDSTGAITWNEPRLKVGIELTDESGKALPGGTLELYDAATGTKIETWNTDGTQKVFSGTLTGGKTYIVRQTGTPNGYVTAADYTFVAESKALSSTENYIQKVTLVDKRVVKSSKKKTDKEDENGTTDANAAGTLTDPANLGKTKKKSPKTGEWF